MVRAARDRVPLCVQVYDLVIDAMSRDGLAPGDQLPGEVAMSQDLRVSRTVLREALFLLEEDGYLIRNPGKRWTVAARRHESVAFSDGLPRLVGDGTLSARRLQARVVDGDSFTRAHFGGDQRALVWETVFQKGDDVVGSALEFMVATAVPSGLLGDGVDAAMDATRSPETLLDALGPGRRARLKPVLWRISAASKDTERMAWTPMSHDAQPVVLTVGLAEGNATVYMAKNLCDLSRFPLTVDLLQGPDAERDSAGE